jgi:hypothetical protein
MVLHIMHLCVLHGTQSKQRLFLPTALTSRFFKPRQGVFSVRYETALYIIKIGFRPYKVNVMFFVLPTAACLLIPISLEAITVAQWVQ